MDLHKLAVDVLNTVRQCGGEMPLAYIEAACREAHLAGIREGRERAAQVALAYGAARDRRGKPYPHLGHLGPEAIVEIEAEERGERIAVEIIARKIRADEENNT